MNILWLSHLLPWPLKAAVIMRCYQLITELPAENQIDILAFHQPRLMAPMVDDLEKGRRLAIDEVSKFANVLSVHEIPCDTRRYGTVSLALLSLFSLSGYTLKWLESRDFRIALQRALDESQYDLIHVDTISFISYMDVILKTDLPVVLDHHNIESHMMFRRACKEKNPFKKLFFYQEALKIEHMEKSNCSRVAHNITCSDEDTSRLGKIAPEAKVTTIPNAIDTRKYEVPKEYKSITRLVFIGTMNWYPNIEAVEYIIRHLSPVFASEFPELSIDIIGANPPEFLRLLASRSPNVTLHGFVNSLDDFTSDAAFLCPITDGGGTKLKIVEAMAMSMPILCHPVAAEGIDILNGKEVIFCNTAEDYLDSIRKIIANPGFCNQLRLHAREKCENTYSYDVVGRRLKNLYGEIHCDTP